MNDNVIETSNDDTVTGIDIHGKKITGAKIIGTALGHFIVRYGEDRLDTTTIEFGNLMRE